MISFQITEKADIPELKKLWIDCFFDLPEAAELFFNRIMNITSGYKSVDDDKVIAAVYLVNCTLNGKNAHYLCGAATSPEYRKRGIMSRLIEYALADAEQRGDAYSLLFPANDGLYDFYARLGYESKCSARKVTLSRQELVAECAVIEDKPNFEELQTQCLKNDFLLQNNNFVDFAIEYYSCYGGKSVYSQNAFAIYELDDDIAEVHYFIYNDIKELKTLLLSIKADKYILTGKSDNPLFAECKSEKYGMIKPLDGAEIPDDTYIGITLN